MIIEFSGLPASGKSSTIQSVKRSFQLEEIQSNDLKAFLPEEFNLKIVWSVLDTISQINNFRNSGLGATTCVIERGLFDRIAWARLLAHVDMSYSEIASELEIVLKRELSLADIGIVFLFLTPYEKIRSRRQERYIQRPAKIFNVVNEETINFLNATYMSLFEEYKGEFPILKIDDSMEEISLMSKLRLVQSAMEKVALNKI